LARRARISSANALALWILVVLAALLFLRAARELLIPIALAVLISYALEPAVAWLQRHRVPRLAGAGLVLLTVVGAGGWGVYALREDAMQVIEAVPNATQRAREMVQGGGIAQALQMCGAAMVITSLEGWLLTPPLMGKAERMSALAVFLGLLLWTWLWGAWGTILAVPMLAVVKSVADHTERFKPVGRLMAP
jgi:predicted PurR-regulated permease PerM